MKDDDGPKKQIEKKKPGGLNSRLRCLANVNPSKLQNTAPIAYTDLSKARFLLLP